MNKLKKNSLLGKIVLIIISLFLGVSLISFNYFAIGRSVNITGFEVSYLTAETSDQNNWTASINSISGTVTGESGVCGDTKKESTLSICYAASYDASIEFDYTIEKNGTVSIDGNDISNNTGHFAKNNVKNGDKIVVIISSLNSTSTKIKLYNITCKVSKNITLIFKPSLNGSYLVNGNAISTDYTFQTTGDTSFSLEALPNEGYKFSGWSFNGSIISQEVKWLGTYPDDAEVTAIFIDSRLPTFLNSNKQFDDLDEAIKSAKNSSSKNIYVIKDGTLVNGTSIEKRYVLSDGVNLIIPQDENYLDNTSFKDPNFSKEAYTAPKTYRKLNIGANVCLEIKNGSSLCASATLHAAAGSQNTGGSPTGTCGLMVLEDTTSKVIVEDKGELYAYGFITGNGRIEAKNGSLIVESYQIADFKGGSASSKVDNSVFLFNQYYVQNIESEIVYDYGATENTKTALYALRSIHKANFNFIYKTGGSSQDSGLFKLSSGGKLSKKYDPTNDRIVYKLENGTADLSSITLTVASMKVDSSKYVLPITNNMEIIARTGTTVNINQDLCFLPGTKFVIEEGATVNISSGKKIFLYDKDNWIGKNYTFPANTNLKSVIYSPTPHKTRTDNDLINTILDINGTINVEDGAGIYTTYSNHNYANVFSSNGTGSIAFKGNKLSNAAVYQFNCSTNKTERNGIKELMLRNSINEAISSGDTYCDVSEENSLKDITFYFDIVQNKWTKKSSLVSSYIINFVDANNSSLLVTKEYTPNDKFTFPTSDDELFNAFKYKGYKVKKWKIEGVGIYDAGKEYTLASSRNLDAYALYGGWVDLNGEKYYIDYETGDYYKGLKKVDYNNEIKICKFKEDGAFDLGYTGTYLNPVDNKYYFIESGVVKEKGFYKYVSSLTSNDYNYVFVSDDNTLLKGGTYYINIDDKTQSILPSGTYNFDANGLIIKEDKETSSYNEDNVYIKNIDNKGDSAFINGIRVGVGLFKDGNYLKYADSKGFIVKNATYYVSKTNNINDIKEGLYYFDNEGRMYDESFTLIEAK